MFLEDSGGAVSHQSHADPARAERGAHARGLGDVRACARCRTPPDEPALTLEETLRDRLEPLRVPAAMGLSFGHVTHHFTIPLGIRARFDCDRRTLTVLEPR